MLPKANKGPIRALSRRHFLQIGAGSALTTAWLLNGCTSPMSATGAGNGRSTQPLATATSPATTSVLRVALAAVPDNLDPALFTTTEAFQFGFMVYDGLLWVDHSLTPQPMLAETWTHSADLLTWTFTLRQGVTFHHGTPFTAQDVVYTFTRLLDAQTGSPLRTTLQFIDKAEALDDYTVVLRLRTPNMDLPLLLGAAQVRIVAHDYTSKQLATRPSGTGPFRVTARVGDERISFVRNPTYWDAPRPYLHEVHHLYINDGDARVQALRQGQVDLIADISDAQAASLHDQPDLQIIEQVSGAYQTIVMQATEAPFQDARVRLALKLCVDRARLQAQVLGGRGALGNDQPLAAINPFWADLPPRLPDIAKARRLLKAAGYPNGLQLDLVTSASRPGMVELATAFQAMAAPAGIHIQVIKVPADVYWTDYGGKTPFHIGNWNMRSSADETFMLAYHSTSTSNESKWSDPKLDVWLDAARRAADPAQRKALYTQVQQLISDEGAVIIPYFRPILTALRSKIQGFTPHPAGWLDLRDVR